MAAETSIPAKGNPAADLFQEHSGAVADFEEPHVQPSPPLPPQQIQDEPHLAQVQAHDQRRMLPVLRGRKDAGHGVVGLVRCLAPQGQPLRRGQDLGGELAFLGPLQGQQLVS